MLYHLSKSSSITKLTPKIPECAVEMYENMTIPRCCFAKTIEGCLSALQDKTPEIYFIYTPIKNINEYKTITPSVYDVIDGPSNGEIWILEEVGVKCIGKILSFENDYNKKIFTKRGICYFHHYKYKIIDK